MNAELNGIITDVFPVETYRNFEKRVLWVKEVDVQYPNHYAIELHQNDVNIADKFKPGDIVKCKIDVRGRAYKTKDGKAGIVNTLKCWAISLLSMEQRQPSERQQTGGIPKSKAEDTSEEPDLPF